MDRPKLLQQTCGTFESRLSQNVNCRRVDRLSQDWVKTSTVDGWIVWVKIVSKLRLHVKNGVKTSTADLLLVVSAKSSTVDGWVDRLKQIFDCRLVGRVTKTFDCRSVVRFSQHLKNFTSGLYSVEDSPVLWSSSPQTLILDRSSKTQVHREEDQDNKSETISINFF